MAALHLHQRQTQGSMAHAHLFTKGYEMTPSNDRVDLDLMEVFIASELEHAQYLRVRPLLAELRLLRDDNGRLMTHVRASPSISNQYVRLAETEIDAQRKRVEELQTRVSALSREAWIWSNTLEKVTKERPSPVETSPVIVAWAVGNVLEAPAIYNIDEFDRASDAARRWGKPITGLVQAPNTPTFAPRPYSPLEPAEAQCSERGPFRCTKPSGHEGLHEGGLVSQTIHAWHPPADELVVTHKDGCQKQLTTELHFKETSPCTCGAENGYYHG